MEEMGPVGMLKVAAVQMEPKLNDNQENVARCLEFIQIAAGEGARLIVFPECAISGYMFPSLSDAMMASETVPGPSTDLLMAACQDLNLYVVIGLLESGLDACYNTAALLGPWDLLDKYRKLHLPQIGVDRFAGRGEGPINICETEIGRLGLGICYDAMFPEYVRVLSLMGADILVLPTNWPETSSVYPDFVVQTRAAENHVFVVAANRVGEEGGATFIGRSMIVNCHRGDILA